MKWLFLETLFTTIYYVWIFTPSHFSEQIKNFPFSCVYILCDFEVLFKKNSKKFYFRCFSAKFGGWLLNVMKNILL